MKMKRYYHLFFPVLLLSFFSAVNVQGGDIGDRLATLLPELEPDAEVAVIITMADQLDLKPFRYQKKKERRVNINKALRDKANKDQLPVLHFLEEIHAQRIISYWGFNGMAATILADQVKELADLPGVGIVRLDDTISIDQAVPAYSSGS